MQVDPKAELYYPMNPFNAMGNNPISYADPDGDTPAHVGAAIIGAGFNLWNNWDKIGSFKEGLMYASTGAVAGVVSLGNPYAAGAILAGGNKVIQAIHGDFTLDDLDSFNDIAASALDVGLDFVGGYGIGDLSQGLEAIFVNGNSMIITNTHLVNGVSISGRPAIAAVASGGSKVVLGAAKNLVTHSSKELGENLVKAGFQRPLNSAAHHIVAGGSKNSYAQLSRDILKRAGIGIDDATNGVFLPKNLSVANPPTLTHSTIHTKVYFKNVYNRLSRVPLNNVGRELNVIRSQLLNGTFIF